jgi:RNA polymerase sigma-70 factor (ECF subfamily)
VTRTHQSSSPSPTRPPRSAGEATAVALLDPDSQTWLDHLAPTSPEHDSTVEALHQLLLKAARFEIQRRRAGNLEVEIGSDDLAEQAAADALVHLLDRLDDFHGQSRFTTWAMKFAVVEAGIKARRRAWSERKLSLEPASWTWIADGRATRGSDPETAELLAAVRTAICRDLSRRQRQVLVATAVNGIPIDVVAERLNTTRGSLYKTIHAARRKLRAALAARGLSA